MSDPRVPKRIRFLDNQGRPGLVLEDVRVGEGSLPIDFERIANIECDYGEGFPSGKKGSFGFTASPRNGFLKIDVQASILGDFSDVVFDGLSIHGSGTVHDAYYYSIVIPSKRPLRITIEEEEGDESD